MKALSIRQPWADLIVSGHKDIENRTWPTKYRGTVLIHAGKQFDTDSFNNLRINPMTRQLMKNSNHSYEMGGIVGVAEIVDCVIQSDSLWYTGEFGFVLHNARPLPFIPLRGMLGFFDVPADYQVPVPAPNHRVSDDLESFLIK